MRSLSRVPNLWIALAMQVLEVGEIQREEKIGLALPCRDKVRVIIDGTATNTVGTGLVERISDFLCIKDDHGCRATICSRIKRAARSASTRKPSAPPVSVAKVSFSA